MSATSTIAVTTLNATSQLDEMPLASALLGSAPLFKRLDAQNEVVREAVKFLAQDVELRVELDEQVVV